MTAQEEADVKALAKKVKAKIDRRLLILYGVLVAVLVLSIAYITHDINETDKARHKFEQAIIANCEASQKNTQALNGLLDGIIRSVESSKDLTDEEKQDRIEFYEAGRQAVPECPPITTKE